MPHALAVSVTAVDTVHDIPGRFGAGGLRELVTTLDGTVHDDEDVYDALRRTFAALPAQALAERLLDAVLLKPPIPAGCEALVNAMTSNDLAPWRTHEIVEDRVWLWYCHSLLHRAFPEQYPAPTVRRVQLAITNIDPAARLPGKRTAAHDRTTFVARLLAGRPGGHAMAQLDDHVEQWAFDVVWWVDVGDRHRPDDAFLAAHHASEDAVASGRCFTTDMLAWLPEHWAGDLTAGQHWSADS